jgi:hypothetical protein
MYEKLEVRCVSDSILPLSAQTDLSLNVPEIAVVFVGQVDGAVAAIEKLAGAEEYVRFAIVSV